MRIRAVAATTAAGRVPVAEGNAVDRVPRRVVGDRDATIGIRAGRARRVAVVVALENRADREDSAMSATSVRRSRSRSRTSHRLRW